jgi:PAS domain S-box-containing protein
MGDSSHAIGAWIHAYRYGVAAGNGCIEEIECLAISCPTGEASVTDTIDTSQDANDEKELLVRQSLKYAEDIVTVYEEEKAKRQELEAANERLRCEIEERERSEEALRQSEERFRAVFESAQDCIYIKDRSFRYTHVCPAMENLFRLNKSNMLGKTDDDLYGPQVAQRLRIIDRRVLKGESIEQEHTVPVNGVPTTFLETKVPLRDSSGKVIGLCGIARNITDRRQAVSAPVSVTVDSASNAMRMTLDKARLVASQQTTILLLGESGTGKDFMARFIHNCSERANGPFFAINCASVSAELAESELFGHEPGSFTGARARKRGLLELAEGGTLFLNEVGELSLSLQAKLLTFLDTRSFTRVGGEKNISVNARLIAATNRELEEEVETGRFRRDLFYRLNVISIRIPPLRERREDIAILVHHLVSELQTEIRLPAEPSFDPDVMETLKAHDWPGNVRELRNRLERALILSAGGVINASALGLSQTEKIWTFATDFPQNRSLNEVSRDLKRSLVLEALRRTGGNRVSAARLLGISRNSLNHYLKTLGIEDEAC